MITAEKLYCGALFWAVADQNITRALIGPLRTLVLYLSSSPSHNCNKNCPSRPSDVYINDVVKKILGRWGAGFFLLCINQNFCLTFSINLTKKSRVIVFKIPFYGAALTFFSLVERLYFSIFLPSLEGNIKYDKISL